MPEKINEVKKVEITTLIDNYIDLVVMDGISIVAKISSSEFSFCSFSKGYFGARLIIQPLHTVFT